MWVRGLKRNDRIRQPSVLQSHPMWVRGLKHYVQRYQFLLSQVASYVGAWIETAPMHRCAGLLEVASYVGAWIETCRMCLW